MTHVVNPVLQERLRKQREEHKRANRLYDYPKYHELVRRARECLLWRMSPDYYDSLTDEEYAAWIDAWNELQDEEREASKSK